MKKAQAARDEAAKAQLAAEEEEAAAQPEDEEDEENVCGLCAYPMVDSTATGNTYDCKMRFPSWDWKLRGCECPDAKICLDCTRREAFRSAQRCCLNPNCHKIMVKCPWCRVPMGFENLYYDWLHNDC